MTDRESLLDRAAELDWFHAIDFGDCQSPGRSVPASAHNKTLFGIMDMLRHVDLTGLDCIDIGTVDGLVAFNMASRGAKRVIATDIPRRETFSAARELLGLDVELFDRTTFETIFDQVDEHSFDVVVCSGVMYHMLNPFDCILRSRRLLRRNGLLLFQTWHHANDEQATLDFNPVSGRLNKSHVFWVPSRSAVTGMLALGGFQLLAVRTGTKHGFISTLARNVNAEAIVDAPDLILQNLEGGGFYPEFQRVLPKEKSAATYRGPQDDAVIDDETYEPDFPPHPTVPKPIIGSRFKVRMDGDRRELPGEVPEQERSLTGKIRKVLGRLTRS